MRHSRFAVASLLAVALASPGCALEGDDLASTESLQQELHSWGRYHWARTSNPFTLKLIDSVVDSAATDAWNGVLATAVTDWSVSEVLDLAVEAGDTSRATRKKCSAVTGKVRVCNEKYGYNGWVGLASIRASGDHITRATVKLNDSYFDTPSYNTQLQRNRVMCQEVGHAFGLDHQDEEQANYNLGTCMDYTGHPAGGYLDAAEPANEHPNAHDYEQLAIIYAHLDTTTTIASSAGGASADAGDDDFGTPVHGRSDLFVKDLGGGNRRFTWVEWAE